MSGENQTVVHEFLLVAFNNITHRGWYLLFFFLLLIYLVTVVGNILIILAVYFNVHLHAPMYFFLSNFSFSEVVFITNITPKMLFIVQHGEGVVPVTHCIAQYYVYCSSIWSDCVLLTIMSYDRLLAICNPLRYSSLMSHRLCVHLVIWTWISGFLVSVIECVMLSGMSFCAPNVIDHYFCDFVPMIRLSCSDTYFIEMTDFALTFPVFIFPVVSIVVSYIGIVFIISQISTTTGRKKAFSTCSSHVTVVCVYYGTCIFVYMFPSTDDSLTLKKGSSLLYIVGTPLINPFIYSLRNKEIKLSIEKLTTDFKNLMI